MSSMYAIQPNSQSSTAGTDDSIPRFTPNILPCRVHHDGPIESTERYWAPVADEKDNKQTAHFRGRKLRGRRVALPDGYRGIVATPTDRELPTSQPTDRGTTEDEGEAEPEEPVKILEAQGTFEDIVVWGHEIPPAADDSFVKGVEEWLRFAESMHTAPAPTPTTNGNKDSTS